ncbi:DNA directed RNA polymerase [Ostreococcus tauri]|uniref:DNA directed RNA polymerase n=1 Tax=Ostreococcus tauri TaxID=70448 RepID=A0A1Y5HXK2_OSTTA|nr:DNA directed RNA polymerase [Ostreococcus tauri]
MNTHTSTNSSTSGVSYNCGDCGSEVVLRPGDVVICRDCGYRILYKKRTKQGTSNGESSVSTFHLPSSCAVRSKVGEIVTKFSTQVVQYKYLF